MTAAINLSSLHSLVGVRGQTAINKSWWLRVAIDFSAALLCHGDPLQQQGVAPDT